MSIFIPGSPLGYDLSECHLEELGHCSLPLSQGHLYRGKVMGVTEFSFQLVMQVFDAYSLLSMIRY